MNGVYRAEVFGELGRARVAVHEFVLTAERGELERRIEGDVLFPDDASRDRAAREWRLAKLGPVAEALPALTPTPRYVDTTKLTPAEVGGRDHRGRAGRVPGMISGRWP